MGEIGRILVPTQSMGTLPGGSASPIAAEPRRRDAQAEPGHQEFFPSSVSFFVLRSSLFLRPPVKIAGHHANIVASLWKLHKSRTKIAGDG